MPSIPNRIARYLFLPLFTLLLAASASAQRHDFTATYKIANVNEMQDKVDLTLVLTLHNATGKDVRDSAIVLYSSDPAPVSVGAFDLVKLVPANRSVTVSQTFTVSKSDYQHLQWGMHPHLDFLTPDGNGGTLKQPLDLIRQNPSPKTAQ
jgi:hypothetical protein